MKHLLVTRPLPQGEHLAKSLLAAGFDPILFPSIVIESVDFSLTDDDKSAEIVIFLSPSAAEFAGIDFLTTTATVIAVGEGTAKTLQALGFAKVLMPKKYSSEGLLAMPELSDVRNKKVTVVKGVGGRRLLTDGLQERQAQWRSLDVYQRKLPVLHLSPFQLEATDLIVATSIQCIENLIQLTPSEQRQQLLQKPLLVSSQRIANRAQDLGFDLQKIKIAENASAAALLACLK